MKKEAGKNLSLKTETVRTLSTDELKDINGGMPTYCWTITIPSSGILTTIPITMKKC